MWAMSAGILRQQLCERSQPRCRENPPRSIIQTAIVLLRLGWLSSQGSSGVEQWPAASSCADNWGQGNGMGEWRQGRWWLLSSPRLAGPITDRLNMTELTLLSYSEGERKSMGAREFSTGCMNCKRFSPSWQLQTRLELPAYSHRGSVAAWATYYFHAGPQIMSEVIFLNELFTVNKNNNHDINYCSLVQRKGEVWLIQYRT